MTYFRSSVTRMSVDQKHNVNVKTVEQERAALEAALQSPTEEEEKVLKSSSSSASEEESSEELESKSQPEENTESGPKSSPTTNTETVTKPTEKTETGQSSDQSVDSEKSHSKGFVSLSMSVKWHILLFNFIQVFWRHFEIFGNLTCVFF